MRFKRFLYCLGITFLVFGSIHGQALKDEIYFNMGITLKPYVIDIAPGTEAKYLLINNPHINKIQCFRNGRELFTTGDHMPFNQRTIPVRYFVIPLDTSNFTKNRYTFVLQKKAENLSGKVKLLTAHQYEKMILYEQRMLGGILGCLFVIFSIVFIMIVVSRKIGAFVFMIYISSSVIWILNDAGLFYQYLWPNSPKFHQLSRTVFSTTSLSAYVFMILRQYRSRFNILIKLFLSGFVLFIVIRLAFLFIRLYSELNEDTQLAMLKVNSIVLFVLFMCLFYIIYFKVFDEASSFFEKSGLFLYWILVVSLSIHQLGFDLFGTFQYEAEMLFMFFILQNISIALGMIISYHRNKLMLEKEQQLILLNQQKLINESVVAAQNLERNRIGRSLHDEVGNLLSGIKLIIAKISKKITDPRLHSDISDINSLVSQSIQKNHQIVYDLVLPDFGETSLKQIILRRIKYFSSESGIQFKVVMNDLISLPHTFVPILYRIIIELINNTIKHAQAVTIRIVCEENMDEFILEYFDDGHGFDVQDVLQNGGLRSFLYNLRTLHGEYFVSSDENGTYYKVKIKKDNP